MDRLNSFLKDPHQRDQTKKYIQFLWEYNKKINLFSRRATKSDLFVLTGESFLLESHIKQETVVDMGSGNGLLGIPIAIKNPQKAIVLVEPKQKKYHFLVEAKSHLKIDNLEIACQDARGFFTKFKNQQNCIVSRGFPDNQMLVDFLKQRATKSILLITSLSKVKKIQDGIEKLNQNLYNIPLRDNLKIFKLESVSRETNEKKL